ncbi:MAG: acyl-CoA dehydrogenase [Saprospiraceae bacterium]|nr:acyl-CoA dehydrogenase [Saprospiraceae bacterium]
MNQYISHRNLRFLLYEVLGTDKLCQHDAYADYNHEAFDMALDAAKQISDTQLFPFYVEMDRKKAIFDNGKVTTHPQLKVLIQSIAEGGWIAAALPTEVGGLQMPHVLCNAALLTFYAANVNACYPFLTKGAANLISSFGSQALKDTYLPAMFDGSWQGTMALTEPQAGSSLTDILTSAEPTDTEGVYKIEGQKIFISGGDHDAVDNVVHLCLARIKGAPAGTKGISLFVVPKFRPENGDLVQNNVTCAGIYGKMGQKGYIAAHLMFGEQGDCLGYLVGEPHKGLPYMFQMMNEARIGTGLVAAGQASAAYYTSLKYAKERPQGRMPSSKNPLDPPVLIVEHADVRRMLLFQKATTEGGIALLMQCSFYADLAHVGNEEEAANAHLLLELLTPIAKSYPSELGIQSVSTAIQTLGGAGYCDDYPLELLYRDIRVNAIYEGTTGIHGLDILGRKVSMLNGKAFILFTNEVNAAITEGAKSDRTAVFAQQLGEKMTELTTLTQKILVNGREKGAEVMLADATLYLDYFGLVVIAWQWLKQGIAAEKALAQNVDIEDEKQFYESKIVAMRYFFEYELPKTNALNGQLLNFDKLTVSLDSTVLV